MTIYVVNAFSIGMIPEGASGFQVKIYEARDLDKTRYTLEKGGYKSYIGHESTARLLTELLKLPINVNREKLVLSSRANTLLLVQVRERLEEGKLLTYEELKEMFEKGLIKLYWLNVIIEE